MTADRHSMIAIENFFDHLKDFAHAEIFADIKWVWEPLKPLEETIATLIREKSGNAQRLSSLEGTTVSASADHENGKIGKSLFVNQWVEIKTPLLLESLGIWIGKGTVLEPSAILKGSMIIGENCEIRQGAYIRGNAIVGNHCVIGHATEIKNSIIMNHSEAGHFNYIGDSILGRHVNMGAGSRLANLQFRTGADKDREEQIFPEIPALIENKSIATGLNKFGSIVGDNSELGCNAVLCPGALVGKDNWIVPNSVVPKGYYPPNSIFSSKNRK
jgi:NDP-sugar pyrophosphorylase family protein